MKKMASAKPTVIFCGLTYIVSHILHSSSMFSCSMCIHFYFPKVNNIDHLTKLSISSGNSCLSPSRLTLLNTLVSSANFNTSNKKLCCSVDYLADVLPCSNQ